MIVFFDTETKLFRPGFMAPRIVCVQWCVDDQPAHLMTARGEFAHESGALFGPTENTFSSLFRFWYERGATLVGHNVFYDLGVFCAHDTELVPLVFDMLRRNLVTCTMVRQKLADIGRGKYRGFFNGPVWIQLDYNLGSVARRHGGHADKDDPFRLRYGEFADVPLSEWPEGAIKYGLGDPLATRVAYFGQESRYPAALLVDQFAQCRKYWALHLASVWGLRTSLRGVMSLESGARQELDELGALLREHGLVKPDGVRDTKAAKARMLASCAEARIEPRQTKSGDVCLDSDACNSVGDPLLEAYAQFSSYKKVLSNDVEALKGGVLHPIHTHFDLAETGRTTSSKPNVQNPRRLPGVRECFVPRGFVE